MCLLSSATWIFQETNLWNTFHSYFLLILYKDVIWTVKEKYIWVHVCHTEMKIKLKRFGMFFQNHRK